MPITTSLNEPLSGAEIKEIVLHRIRTALDRNSTLQDDLAYPGFSLNFTVALTYLSVHPARTTEVWGAGELLQPAAEGQELVAEEVKGEHTAEVPNAARMEHDLPVPVMVKGQGGVPQRRMLRIEGGPAAGLPVPPTTATTKAQEVAGAAPAKAPAPAAAK